jgi:V8-like Glu-specific endopeptidase
LIKVLKECDQLRSDSKLSAVFITEELRPWKDGLPEAGSVTERVDLVISYLVDKRRKSGENALVLFLKTIGESIDIEDDRHDQLLTLADQIEWIRDLPPKADAKTLESNPSAAQMLWMEDAVKMLECARSVSRIDVARQSDGSTKNATTGTAWLLAPGIALTCRHVIEALGFMETSLDTETVRTQASTALLTFDYTAGGKGVQYGASSLEHISDAPDLDYALLRLKDRDDMPLRGRGYLRLDADAPLTVQSTLYIIQYPLGQPQQGAGDVFVRNSDRPGYILYKTPTEPGTSGAPVFSRASWRVVAVHTGENSKYRLREGLLISAILSDLKIKKADLYQEIMRTQEGRCDPCLPLSTL